MRGRSLRARLLVGVIALATVGLGVADVATYTSLRTFLLRQVDQTLQAADASIALQLPPLLEQQGSASPSGLLERLAIPGECLQLRGVNGRRLSTVSPLVPTVATAKGTGAFPVKSLLCRAQLAQTPIPPSPRLPEVITLPRNAKAAGAARVAVFDVPAMSGGGSYRVRASVGPSVPQLMVVIATPLTGLTSTLHRLIEVEILVTVGVLLALAGLGLWVVRFALRPLEAIGRTAAAIASGDLGKRIERTDEKTEVGRLGTILNTMLSQIESGFRAREATEQKLRRFVADASHELRTPLAAIRAYAELFSRGASSRPDDLARSMQGITRESERMSTLVDELILLAHLDDGRPLRREAVDLESVVNDSVDTARAVEPERPFATASESVVVTGDRDRLRQLVDNLLANVRAHTPPGAPVQVVLTRNEQSAVLAVIDSGPGMTADERMHVFERFYRSDLSRSRASGGAGLGLAIVSAIAEAHGGAVSVQSEPGGGATFAITLPLAPVESSSRVGDLA